MISPPKSCQTGSQQRRMAISIAAAGGTAGAMHGYLWGRSETFFSRYSSRYLACHAHGVMISHGCSHTAMFASYEGVKTYLIYDEQWDAPMSIVVAGAISGVVVDIVAHFAAPFEHYPLKVALKQLKHVKMPSVSEMSKSAGATLLGTWTVNAMIDRMEQDGSHTRAPRSSSRWKVVSLTRKKILFYYFSHWLN
ncbi:hypothetical protein AC1031_005113 [Aphanomyces cochlioides]|nr:hypothetical protein AC1031_005113 [Aphanomyces cochlioides]